MNRSTPVLSSVAPEPISKATVSSSPTRTAQRSAERPASESVTAGSAPAARRAATTSDDAFAAAASARPLVASLAVSPFLDRSDSTRSKTVSALSA